MAMEDDTGEASTQCALHPYKNNTPGGICAFCLQEKLGKLVSSSLNVAVFPSSSSSPSPSFRSETRDIAANNNSADNTNRDVSNYCSRRSRMAFLLTQRKKKMDQTGVVLKRSKSAANPRSRGVEFSDGFTPNKRGFWSFLYSTRKTDKPNPNFKNICYASSANDLRQDEGSPDPASFDRKVSRSRSVGCGSRSFSGDFFERISTGFGDCTLRRVESQREGKSKLAAVRQRAGAGGQDCIKERVKCGGLFSGFTITSSSSSSSSSTEDHLNGKRAPPTAPAGNLAHGRSKSWGWAFASPIRAFSKPSGKRDINASNKNITPNLAAIPSLLSAGG